jgi:hypothetical protein
VATRVDRATLQSALRAAAIAFVAVWLFVDELRAWIPIWLPLVILLAAEVEFVLRGRRETPGRVGGRALPGPEDADLGFGELVEDDEGVRFLPPPSRPAGSRPRRAAWLAGAAAAVAVAVGLAARSDRAATWAALPATERASVVERITAEATRIAGAPVRVRCDESYSFTGAGSDTLGVAFPRAGLAYLDQSVCRALRDLVAGEARGGERVAEALVVLAHEAVHLRGERREGVTECLALQEAGPLAVRLGLEEKRIRELLGAELDRRLAERSAIRAAYALPSSCRDGGALDLRPRDSRFPY